MAYSCSQCPFAAQFESALAMHCQLHHEPAGARADAADLRRIIEEKSKSLPLDGRAPSPTRSVCSAYKLNKGIRLGLRGTSATRLFGKLRERICRGRAGLATHNEEDRMMDLSTRSDCTSKALKFDSLTAVSQGPGEPAREVYSCHLCDFDTNRITALDRHLLDEHQLTLDELLTLVLARTRAGVAGAAPSPVFGRRPYYRAPGHDISSGEYVIETVTPKIKIMKHTASNTDLLWTDIPDDLKANCCRISRELEQLMQTPSNVQQNELLKKMATLSECMCKFVSSSNALTKVLSRDDGKWRRDEAPFALPLSETPRDGERAHSEKIERSRNKHSERYRSEKSKLNAESFLF